MLIIHDDGLTVQEGKQPGVTGKRVNAVVLFPDDFGDDMNHLLVAIQSHLDSDGQDHIRRYMTQLLKTHFAKPAATVDEKPASKPADVKLIVTSEDQPSDNPSIRNLLIRIKAVDGNQCPQHTAG